MNQNKNIFSHPIATAQTFAQQFPVGFWIFLCVIFSGTLGIGAVSYLLSQPKQSFCLPVLLPITSASSRFYCAQAAAEQNTADSLVRGIDFLTGLPPDHPRAAESQQKREELGMKLLNLADKAFDAGNLETAIDTLEQIPKGLKARQLVADRLKDWQTRWEGQTAFYDSMEKEIRQSRWNSAMISASGNLNVTGMVKKEYGRQ